MKQNEHHIGKVVDRIRKGSRFHFWSVARATGNISYMSFAADVDRLRAGLEMGRFSGCTCPGIFAAEQNVFLQSYGLNVPSNALRFPYGLIPIAGLLYLIGWEWGKISDDEILTT